MSFSDLAALPSNHPIILVSFWATWCGPCLMEIPYLNELHAKRPDIHIYGISVDDPALGTEVFKFVKKYRIQYPVYLRERMKEGNNSQWFHNTPGIPITFIFKNGVLHNTIVGAVEKKEEFVEAVDGPSEKERYAQEQEEPEDDQEYPAEYDDEE
jgi:thiol-disulfide isomerase/thioredoxin